MRNLLSQMPGIGPVSDADMEVVLKLADSGKFTLRLLSWMDEFVAYWGFGDLHV
jgi:hypothetical protein